MLSKLIKYDMKALSRILLFPHFFILILAFIGRIFITSNIHLREPNHFEVLYFMLFFLSLAVMSGATYIIIGIHFYKNLFSAQGYLSWTLPVTVDQHLLSKLISAFVWTLLNALFTLLSLFIFAFGFGFHSMGEVVDEFYQFFGNSAVSVIVATTIYMLLTLVASILTIYFSITLGQLFANHRILASTVIYGALSLITQIFYILAIFSANSNYFFVATENLSNDTVIGIYHRLLLFANISTVILIIVFYVIARYLAKRKLNLA
jgi:hypothetical protein